ncbi:MAG: hypothetical protein WC787_05315 [Patescibacteria group bacterium]
MDEIKMLQLANESDAAFGKRMDRYFPPFNEEVFKGVVEDESEDIIVTTQRVLMSQARPPTPEHLYPPRPERTEDGPGKVQRSNALMQRYYARVR